MRMTEAKAIRQELGGVNEYKHQCDSIPAVINPSRHDIHLKPCYKKFTLIITRESTLVMIMAQKNDIDLKEHPKQAKFFFQIIAISVNKNEKLSRERYK